VPDDAKDEDVYHELLDISAVPVPGDPTALVERQRSALAALVRELATDIPEIAETPGTAPEGHQSENDRAKPFGPKGEYKNLMACIMANQDQDDPEAFCKALEAETAERSETVDTGEVEPTRETWEDTAAAMVAALDPASDDDDKTRRRRYNALLPAYRRAGKVAPEFMSGADLRALGPEEWRGLWLEGEVETRAGKQLSTRNSELVQQAYDLTGQAHEALGQLLEAAMPKEPEAETQTKREAEEPAEPSELARWLRILGKN
jgi:hypothetical protein